MSLHAKAIKVNKLLAEELAVNGLDMIDNSNVTFSSFQKDGLHISDGEARKFSDNVGKFIKCCQMCQSAHSVVNNRPSKRSKRNGLKVAFLNIGSLRKHKHELEVILRENDIAIIGLSETRLNEQIEDSELHITGYYIFRNDRDENGGGGSFICKRESAIPNSKIEK